MFKITKNNGGLETVIAIVIITGLVVALIFKTVIPMSQSADDVTDAATGALVTQQTNIKPSAATKNNEQLQDENDND